MCTQSKKKRGDISLILQFSDRERERGEEERGEEERGGRRRSRRERRRRLDTSFKAILRWPQIQN